MNKLTIKSIGAMLLLATCFIVKINAQSISASATSQTDKGGKAYYCVGTAVTYSVSDPDDPGSPPESRCCDKSGDGDWIFDKYNYRWNINGRAAGVSSTASDTFDEGGNSVSCEITAQFKCSKTGATMGGQSFSASETFTAYIDDTQTQVSIPVPNNAPNIQVADKTNARIHLKYESGILTMKEYALKGDFTNIRVDDTFSKASGNNSSGHTDCGATKTLTYNPAAGNVGFGINVSGANISAGVSVGVSYGTTSVSGDQVGKDHKRTHWQVYDRFTQVKTATSSNARIVVNESGTDKDLGPANVQASLPGGKVLSGAIAKDHEIDCCPNT